MYTSCGIYCHSSTKADSLNISEKVAEKSHLSEKPAFYQCSWTKWLKRYTFSQMVQTTAHAQLNLKQTVQVHWAIGLCGKVSKLPLQSMHMCTRVAQMAAMDLKVHKRENFFGSDFELYTFL